MFSGKNPWFIRLSGKFKQTFDEISFRQFFYWFLYQILDIAEFIGNLIKRLIKYKKNSVINKIHCF
jgi:hypothetical protein